MIQFLQKLATLLLSNDVATHDWMRSHRMRASGQRLVIAMFMGFIITVAARYTPISEIILASDDVMNWYRTGLSLVAAVQVMLLIALAIEYFRFTLGEKRPVRLVTILFFYLVGMVLFGTLYYTLFLASPTSFISDATLIRWTRFGDDSVIAWRAKLMFQLYSALKSTGGTLRYIESGAVIVSIVNYVQSVYTIALVSLLIAGYVNQRTR